MLRGQDVSWLVFLSRSHPRNLRAARRGAGAFEPQRLRHLRPDRGSTSAASINFTSGSIGANGTNGSISGNGAVGLDPATGVIAAVTTDLHQPSTCSSVFANNGAGECADAPRLPLEQTQLVADPRAACGFPTQFPSCDQNRDVTVGSGETVELQPGTYGDVTVSGGTLTLAGGEYVVCNFTVNQQGLVQVAAPSTVFVAGRVNVLEKRYPVNPDLEPDESPYSWPTTLGPTSRERRRCC